MTDYTNRIEMPTPAQEKEFEKFVNEIINTPLQIPELPKLGNISFTYKSIIPNIKSYIKKVIFNDPATIIFWTDDTKTVVKAENEPFDPEKGMAMAIAKKVLGNKGNYFETFKKHLPGDTKPAEENPISKAATISVERRVNREPVQAAYFALLRPQIINNAKKADYEDAVLQAYNFLSKALED